MIFRFGRDARTGLAASDRRPRCWLAVALALAALALVAPAAPAQVSFTDPTAYVVGDLPWSVAIGDLNGDSKRDLVVGSFFSDKVSVLLGDGAGGFGDATDFPAGDAPESVAIGDLNGDSMPDLVVANSGSDNVSVLLGDGAGGFGDATDFPAGDAPESVAIGFLNGDSQPDLVVANSGSDNVSVLLGDGAGGFGDATDFPVGGSPNSVAIGFLDGDSQPDLAVANTGSENVSVLLGDGAGGFGDATDFPAGDEPLSVAIGDLNGDTTSDLAVANWASGDVSVLLGDGAGGFGATTNVPVGIRPSEVAIGDLDGDGHADLAVAMNWFPGMVSVLLGDGAGGFGAATDFLPGGAFGTANSVAIGDLNGDSKPDLAVTIYDVFASDHYVSVLLNATSHTPTAVDDSYSTDEDTTLTEADPGVLGNDTDPDGDPLTAALVVGPAHGSLTLNPNGSFTYTPAANYSGPDSFTYRANDGSADSNVATVSITVNPVNDAPTAANDAYSTNEDTALNIFAASGVLANDTDPEGDPLTAALVDGPAHGTLTLNPNGSFTYTPAANYSGPDSFTYRANDGAAASNVATVSITVTPVNDAPTAANDAYSTNEDTPLTVAAPGVLANDTDPDGDALSAVLVSGPSNGTLTLNANGSFTYTPAANYSGPDSFTYRANDGSASSNAATVSITVNPVNDAPTAANDAYSTNEDTPLTVAAPGVLANDTDPDGDALSAVLVSGPSHGTLTLNANGSFTYTPAGNYSGPDSFTYRANDGSANSNVATVSITVNPVNDAPTVTVAAGGTCGANDRSGTVNLTVADPDTAAASLTLSGASNNQALVPNANLSFAGAGANRILTATAAARHTGTATITVTVTDGSATGTVTVTLRASGNGKDTLAGTGGADMLFGQNGKDTLAGQAGNDLLCGGRGKDRLTGGGGGDAFSGGPGTDAATDFNAVEGDTKDLTTP